MIVAYIYLLQDGKYIGTNIYKIGKSTTSTDDTRYITRFLQYNKGTVLHFIYKVPDDLVDLIERKIIYLFEQKYNLVEGREWFNGDCNQMLKDILNIIDECKKRYLYNEESRIAVMIDKEQLILERELRRYTSAYEHLKDTHYFDERERKNVLKSIYYLEQSLNKRMEQLQLLSDKHNKYKTDENIISLIDTIKQTLNGSCFVDEYLKLTMDSLVSKKNDLETLSELWKVPKEKVDDTFKLKFVNIKHPYDEVLKGLRYCKMCTMMKESITDEYKSYLSLSELTYNVNKGVVTQTIDFYEKLLLGSTMLEYVFVNDPWNYKDVIYVKDSIIFEGMQRFISERTSSELSKIEHHFERSYTNLTLDEVFASFKKVVNKAFGINVSRCHRSTLREGYHVFKISPMMLPEYSLLLN